jgi:hypothetical protein
MRSKKFLTIISSIALALTLSSCSSNNANLKNSDTLVRMPQGTPVTDLNQSTVPQTEFDKAKTKLEMSIIHQTPTPMWVPPVMAKVLIMPYVDQTGTLHSYQYAFEQLTEGRWLMGSYLANQNNNIIEKPLADISAPSSSLIQQPLSSPEGIPQTPGVMQSKTSVQNTNTATQSNASFFEGGAPKKTINTNMPTGSGTNNNQQIFENTVNAMKSGG